MSCTTWAIRSCASSSDDAPDDSSWGTIGKIRTPRYNDVVFTAACLSVADPFGTNASTSAILMYSRIDPSGSRSAYSIWSRSRDSSLSIEDQRSRRRSRGAGPPAPTTASGRCAAVDASAKTAGEKSGSKPWATSSATATSPRDSLDVVRRESNTWDGGMEVDVWQS